MIWQKAVLATGDTGNCMTANAPTREMQDPNNAGALVLAAIADLNQVKRAIDSADTSTLSLEEQRKLPERAQSLLLRALKANKHHAPAACGLADQFFFNRQMENAIKCATVACKTADATGLRAEAHFQLARAHHYQVKWAVKRLHCLLANVINDRACLHAARDNSPRRRSTTDGHCNTTRTTSWRSLAWRRCTSTRATLTRP